jgi:hypothetical protein
MRAHTRVAHTHAQAHTWNRRRPGVRGREDLVKLGPQVAQLPLLNQHIYIERERARAREREREMLHSQ